MTFSLAAQHAIGLTSQSIYGRSSIRRILSKFGSGTSGESADARYARLYRMDDEALHDCGLTRQDILREMQLHYGR